MGDVVIRADGLGKQYQLGAAREGYSTLRDQFARLTSLRRLFRREPRAAAAPPFWALRDVSFEVSAGEVIGIIGRNGAGKSTLLKILSRITEPSEGGVDVFGRVGSLLEVGTGFHPELTGRENVYLNGAILGMRRVEIAGKFDEIVAFAEVEKFIDTPVKHYSSGMYTRLAFAVAAHLEPEILIVDEVLAVGDAEFQRKCLGKMGEVSKGGRTVLFVSHNMGAIRNLCSRAVVLKAGSVAFDGPTEDAIPVYLAQGAALTAEWQDSRSEDSAAAVRLTAVRVRRKDGGLAATLAAYEPFRVEIDYRVFRPVTCQIAFRVNRSDGDTVLTTADGDHAYQCGRTRAAGQYRAAVEIPGHLLAPGRYHLLVAANSPSVGAFDLVERALELEVDAVGSLKQLDCRLGVVLPQLLWVEE